MISLTEIGGVIMLAAMPTITLPPVVDTAKIKRLRESAGMTQEDAAAKAGFKSRQAWNNIESGRQMPRIPTLTGIAKALGVKASDLLK